MLVGGIVEGILEEYILVERIVFWGGLLLRVGIVDGCAELHFFGEEAAGIYLHGHVVLLIVVKAA